MTMEMEDVSDTVAVISPCGWVAYHCLHVCGCVCVCVRLFVCVCMCACMVARRAHVLA